MHASNPMADKEERGGLVPGLLSQIARSVQWAPDPNEKPRLINKNNKVNIS